MGTTAEKLKYLNETKAEIKNALETPYNVMRDYPELIKKYIDNQPTKVVTDGICGNAVDVPVKAIEINGNIRQETTEGYNSLNVPAEYTVLSTDINKEVPISLKANTTYTIQAEKINSDNSDVKDYLFHFRYNNANVSHSYARIPISTLKTTYTPPSDIDTVWIYSGTGYNESTKTNTTYKNLMIYEGTEDKPYEPYTGGIPSPNPDYPQEITNVGGYDNLFNKNNIINGSYVSDGHGTFIGNSTSKRTDYIEIQANSYYYIYSDKLSGNWGAWYDKDKKYISGITLGGKKEGVVNSPANAKYMAFTVSYQGNLTDYSNIKINETAIKIKHSGKNLFDELYYSNKILYKKENRYFAAVEMPDSFKTKFYGNGFLKGTDKDLVFGFSNSNLSISNRILSNHVLNKNVEYDFTNADKVYFVIGNGNEINIDIDIDTIFSNYNIMVTTTEETSYEPYHEPIITPINLQGNILSKVGDVKDILKVNRNGEVEIKKNTWEETINTSDFISLSSHNTKGLVLTTSKKKATGGGNDNYLVTNAQRNQTFNDGTVYQNPANFVFVGSPTDTLETIKAKFNGGKILYQLATPQIITLPSISPIELWQGTNIFKLITNLDTDFEVEYVVDKDSVTKEEE